MKAPWYEKVRDLPPEQQQQVLELVKEPAHGKPRETVSQKLARALQNLPLDEFDELPADASANIDHYSYEAPKK